MFPVPSVHGAYRDCSLRHMKHFITFTALLLIPLAAIRAAETAGSAALEAKFGRAEFDGRAAAIRALHLRQQDGSIAPKSVLSLHAPMHDWAVGGYSYAVDATGNRFESRRSVGHLVEQAAEHLHLSGVKLVDAEGKAAPLTEDWQINVTKDGAQAWKIVRKWDGEFAGKFSGAPALFFNSRPNEKATRRNWPEPVNPAGNGVITSVWLESEALAGFWSLDYHTPIYRKPWAKDKVPGHHPAFGKNLCITALGADEWAVAKLYTSFPLDADLRVGTQGHLYRRGSYDDFSEIGVVASAGQTFASKAGLVETTTLTLASQPKEDTGYRLAVKIPDAEAVKALRRYYSGMLNGGTLCDMKLHDFGNETDGWRVGFTPHIISCALAAGVPAAQPVSSKPVSVAQALRESLDMRLDALKPDGRLEWGFSHEPGKVLVDYQFSLPLAAEKYWLHTGDLEWVRGRFDKLELALSVLIQRAEANGGLVGWAADAKTAHANWYLDGIKASGSLAYHNVFYYAALRGMAEMSGALGKAEKQTHYTQLADAVKLEFNRKFWSETACGEGNAAYFDWVDTQGIGHGHFMSCVQYPAIALGLASRQQTAKLLDTANRRLAVLEKENGYTREGTLDLLWPVAKELCTGAVGAGFGKYQNGGMLLTWTYWEIVARAQSGDAAGAWDRMKRFATRAARTNWFEGENSFTMDGKPFGWGSEPYLSDQVTVPAALIDGFLGLRRTAGEITLAPSLPPGWNEMSAEILHQGHRYRVTASSDGKWRKAEVRTVSPQRP